MNMADSDLVDLNILMVDTGDEETRKQETNSDAGKHQEGNQRG